MSVNFSELTNYTGILKTPVRILSIQRMKDHGVYNLFSNESVNNENSTERAKSTGGSADHGQVQVQARQMSMAVFS